VGRSRDIVLLAATEGEAQILAGTLHDSARRIHAGKLTLRGFIGGRPCRLAVSGVGAVNAAQALTHKIEVHRPRLVLQFGVAGAYVPAGLGVGAVACATEEIYGDAGVLTPDGWQPLEALGFPLVPGDPPRYNRFPLDAGLVARAAAVCGAAAGPFLTLAQCTGVRALGDRLHARFGALCESMEGAAAAHVCALYAVPFLEIRGVSNLVEDRDRSRWDVAGAAAAAQEAVRLVIERLDDIMQRCG
jgi:futalosine hydrolase